MLVTDSTIELFLETYDAADHITTAEELESRGWHTVLMTLCPQAFGEEFSADQCKFWDLYWDVLLKIREQRKYWSLRIVPDDPRDQRRFFEAKGCWIPLEHFVFLLILGRALAKSSTMEAAVMLRGCILGKERGGYCLLVCEGQDQADEHVGNVKGLIDDPESRIVEFYPHMQLDPNAKWKGKKAKDRTDLFMTIGGFIVRSKGLNANLRGIRVGNLRPDMIVLDDVDSINDSPDVSHKKLRQISASIIPTQAPKGQATILFGQNLILETGVLAQIHTGKSDVLSVRTTIGVSNTFERFEENTDYRTYLDEKDGRIKHEILPAARPTWKGVDIPAAQKFLNDSGLDTFKAEYMNSFEHLRTGKVFYEWSEGREYRYSDGTVRVISRQVITWAMIEAKLKGLPMPGPDATTEFRAIPAHWRAKSAVDFGYSKDSKSAWGWYAAAAANAPSDIIGRYFGYRSRTFEMTSPDDQALAVWEEMFPDPPRGKANFEAHQNFIDYPGLFRYLETRPRCSRLLQNFRYDHLSGKFKLKPLDPRTIHELTPEGKALFYVKQAQINFKSQVQAWVCSHEKTGEQMTFAQMYGLPLTKVERFEADAGVTEANTLLRGDYTKPHPFYPDEIDPETGLYRLGSPFLFIIVERIAAPRGDEDWKTFREQVAAQVWTQEVLTKHGLTKAVPFKSASDHPDQLRMFATSYAMPSSTKKTIKEEVEERIPQQYRRQPGPRSVEEQMSQRAAKEWAEEQAKIELGLLENDEEDGWQYE